METALKCFSRSGYDRTGVAEICAEAGVSKGAFYHHFATKQTVFIQLLSEWLDELDAQMAASFQNASSVPDAFDTIATMLPKVFEVAAGRLPMFLEFWTQASRDKVIWEATIQPYHRYQQVFARAIQAGVEEGSLTTTDPQLAARLLVALAVGLLLQGVLDPQGADWAETTRQGIDTLMRSLRRPYESDNRSDRSHR
ncbi:MAG TPA: TetR/AcrR family transcriptional regulator [Anaerolineaceae bacterium]|nr:TetR/AcrR family transcriptional regulator [Anaerolineaceae bacterium]